MTLEAFIALFTADEWAAYMFWQMEGQYELWPPFVDCFIVKRTIDHNGFKALLDSMLGTTEIIDQARYDQLMLSQPA